MTTKRVLEDVLVTAGIPEGTYGDPPNFNEILLDIRHPGKPVVVEGPSGTGKTSTVKKVLERLGKANAWMYLSARTSENVGLIQELAEHPSQGVYIIDDFHHGAARLHRHQHGGADDGGEPAGRR